MSETLIAERKKLKGYQPGPVAGHASDASNRVAELQVSAHVMTLETGLFCVFQTPGSPPPDEISGLPGVRITPAPGAGSRPEAVSVRTFRADGWLDGSAALVRVTDGTGQILVTIYQHKGKDAAPRLQVLRLSGEPGTPSTDAGPPLAAAEPAAPVAPAKPDLPNPEVMAHIQRMGDVGCKLGEWLGTKGSGQWVEGFGIAPANGIAAEDLEYQAVLGRDWLSPWVEAGKFCGSRGMALPLLGLRIRLRGAAAKAFECSYSATFIDGSAVGPVSEGEACEADNLAALESFRIDVQPRPVGVTPRQAAVKAPVVKAQVKATPAAQAPSGKSVPAPKQKAKAKA